ncbi:hypothetical protein ACFX1S_029222 [Malus domestica]
MMLPRTQTRPTISDLLLYVWANLITRNARRTMKTSSKSSTRSTLSLCFLSVKMRKRMMKESSMKTAVPLMVTNRILCGYTAGNPYTAHAMQLNRVARYGTGEYLLH